MGGGGNTYDYGFRIYNPQIAKFLSVDPLTSTYPMLTPYQFASNTPIQAIDLDGLEAKIVIYQQSKEGGFIKPIIYKRGNSNSDVEWRNTQTQFKLLAQTATWGQNSNKQDYEAVPVYTNGNGQPSTSGTPVDGTLYIFIYNDGPVRASYDSKPTGEGAPKTPTLGESLGTTKEMFDNNAEAMRDWSRDHSEMVGKVEMGADLTTLSSGGLSSPVTVPVARVAGAVGMGLDFVSTALSLYVGDYEGAAMDAVNIAVPYGLGKVTKKLNDLPAEQVGKDIMEAATSRSAKAVGEKMTTEIEKKVSKSSSNN